MGNGAQTVSAPNRCKSLNCKTILINDSLDGNFPGRGSEPTPENLSELSKTVLENNADFGIAFDGDGDRSIFCDENGKILGIICDIKADGGAYADTVLPPLPRRQVVGSSLAPQREVPDVAHNDCEYLPAFILSK